MTSTEERQMLRDTVAALVDKHASPAAVREAMESERGYDESLWTMLCEQVGVAALVVPEELGGAGGELADAAAVLEELGRGLVPTPLLGTTLAELALLAADEPDTETLEQLAAGAAIGAVVFDPDYVVNGDIADVVVAVDGRPLTRWSDVTAEAVQHHGPDPPAGPGHPGSDRGDRHRSRTGRHRGDPAGRRADRRRRALPGADRRLHQGTRAVRPADRQLPGAQAPDGRPVRRGAVGARRRRRCDRTTPRRCRRRWRDWPPPRPSPRWPARRSSCTAASRSPGSTTSSCTSSGPTAAPSCSVRCPINSPARIRGVLA